MSLPFYADLGDLEDHFDDYSRYTDQELAESPNDRKARLAGEQDVPKGTCRKCGQHIGKGIHFHERACGA